MHHTFILSLPPLQTLSRVAESKVRVSCFLSCCLALCSCQHLQHHTHCIQGEKKKRRRRTLRGPEGSYMHAITNTHVHTCSLGSDVSVSHCQLWRYAFQARTSTEDDTGGFILDADGDLILHRLNLRRPLAGNPSPGNFRYNYSRAPMSSAVNKHWSRDALSKKHEIWGNLLPCGETCFTPPLYDHSEVSFELDIRQIFTWIRIFGVFVLIEPKEKSDQVTTNEIQRGVLYFSFVDFLLFYFIFCKNVELYSFTPHEFVFCHLEKYKTESLRPNVFKLPWKLEWMTSQLSTPLTK